MPTLLLLILFGLPQPSAGTAEALYQHQRELLDEWTPLIEVADQLVADYAQLGLAESEGARVLSEQVAGLKTTRQQAQSSLRAISPTDTVELLAIQERLLADLHRLLALTGTPDLSPLSERARQRGEAVETLDTLTRRQQAIRQGQSGSLSPDEAQAQLAADTTQLMLDVAEHNPEAGRHLQRAVTRMQLARRSIRSGNSERTLQSQQEALEQLQAAREVLRNRLAAESPMVGNSSSANQQNSRAYDPNPGGRSATSQSAQTQMLVSALQEVAKAQDRLVTRMDGVVERGPQEQLSLLNAEREIVRRLGQLGPRQDALPDAVSEATELAQRATQQLAKGDLSEAAGSMKTVAARLHDAVLGMGRGTKGTEGGQIEDRGASDSGPTADTSEDLLVPLKRWNPSVGEQRATDLLPDETTFPAAYAELLRQYYRRISEFQR